MADLYNDYQVNYSNRVVLPNGVSISAKQYIEEFVNPLLKEDTITLKNGAVISKKQFIEEFVLGIGQTEYNGDIEKLIDDFVVKKDYAKDDWFQYDDINDNLDNTIKPNNSEQIDNILVSDYLNSYGVSKSVFVITDKQYAMKKSDGSLSHDDMSRLLANSIFPNSEQNHFGQSVNMSNNSIVVAEVNKEIIVSLPNQLITSQQFEIFSDVLNQIDLYSKENPNKIKLTVFSSENIRLTGDYYTDSIEELKQELKQYVTNKVEDLDEVIVGIPYNEYKKVNNINDNENIISDHNNNIKKESVSQIIVGENGSKKLVSEFNNIDLSYIDNSELLYEIDYLRTCLAIYDVNLNENSSQVMNDHFNVVLSNYCRSPQDFNYLLRFCNDISKVNIVGEVVSSVWISAIDNYKSKFDNVAQSNNNPFDDYFEQLVLYVNNLNNLANEKSKGMVETNDLYNLISEYENIKTELETIKSEIDPVKYQNLMQMIDTKIHSIKVYLGKLDELGRTLGYTKIWLLILMSGVLCFVLLLLGIKFINF